MNAEFNKLVESNKIFFSSAQSGLYNRALALCNLTPEILAARKQELDGLVEERRLMEQAMDTSKVGTSEKKATRKAANDMLAPINVISRRYFRGTEYETSLYLSRRYTNQPPGEDGEPRGRRLKQRSRAAHMNLARYNSILETLENMPEEDRAIYTQRGVTEETLAEFRKRVAEFEDAHITRPQRLEDYQTKSAAWRQQVKNYRGWWSESCELMQAHLQSVDYENRNIILQALGMVA